MAYIHKCPLCGEKLDVDDIDYRFDGNQDEYSNCNHCHTSFIFYIRYGRLWKYEKTKLVYMEGDGHYLPSGWYSDGQETETVYVYKKGQ